MQNTHGAHFRAPTLYEALIKYTSSRTLKPDTISLYDYILKWGAEDWLHLPINKITRQMVAERHVILSKRNGPRGSGKSAANMCMRVIRTLINFVQNVERYPDGSKIIDENPVLYLSHTRQWNKATRRTSRISPAQLKRWYEGVQSTPQPVFRDYLIFLLFTGLRRTEAARLRWKDIDFADRLLTVKETKNGDPHTLPLSEFLQDFLSRRYWYMHPAPDDYVFPGRFRGSPISENYKGYQDLWEACGVNFKLHDLRRTFLTVGQSAGLDLVTLKWLANHRSNSSDVTLGYLIQDPERLREPMERISRQLLFHIGIS